jgi:hypothetical protein
MKFVSIPYYDFIYEIFIYEMLCEIFVRAEMKAFEEDVIHLVSNVKFRKISDPFLNNIAGDLEKVNSSQNVLIFNLPTKQEMSMKLHPKHITNY